MRPAAIVHEFVEVVPAADAPTVFESGEIVRHVIGRHVGRWGLGTGRAGFVVGPGVVSGTVLVAWAGAPTGTVRVEREDLLEGLPLHVRDQDRWFTACRRAGLGKGIA